MATRACRADPSFCPCFALVERRKIDAVACPKYFATDQDRLARFEREAKLLASLNHANIATIHGLEESGGVRFIAMELVEGETLADRLAASGRIEVDEALEIARQIAEALEAAHENGVIHRDLKPANVIVTPEGKVKVLDFGLAKAHEAGGSSSDVSPDLSHSPTMMAATGTGVIMGTAAYMSPEQAKGKPLDKRTDIWSFLGAAVRDADGAISVWSRGRFRNVGRDPQGRAELECTAPWLSGILDSANAPLRRQRRARTSTRRRRCAARDQRGATGGGQRHSYPGRG